MRSAAKRAHQESTITQEDQEQFRKYLLGDVTEEQEEQVELRLLTDSRLAEVFDALEDELIESYVDGELPADERRRFEDYFLRAPEHKVKLGVATALRARSAARRSARRRDNRPWAFYLRLAACLLVVAGLSFGVWYAFLYRSNVDQGMLALQTVYGEQGSVDVRVTGLNHAPAAAQRGPQDRANEVEQERAGLLLRTAVRESPSAESQHALGRYYLLQREFDKALDHLDEALRLDPGNGRIHSDIGAALFERGRLRALEQGQAAGSEDFARSIEHLKKALELDNSLLEALFNRALVYQHQLLLPQAEEDWRRYLEADPNSRWAVEARKNLKQVEEQRKRDALSHEEIFQNFLRADESGDDSAAWRLVSNYYGRTGNVVGGRLIEWYLETAGRDSAGRADEASRAAGLLTKVGELASRRAGDQFFSDLARYYKATTPQQRAALVEARGLMKAGHEGWGRVAVEESLDQFSRARSLFHQAGDACEALVADYWIGFCHFRQLRKAESLAAFGELERGCAANGYKWLQVRALWGLSLVQNDHNELSKSIDYSRRSLALAEQTGDTMGMLNAMGTLIAHHRYLSDSDQALGYIQSSIPLLASISPDPILGSRHYAYAAAALSSLGLNEAAIEYQKEALRYALSNGSPSTTSVNHAELGFIYGRLRRYDEALKHIRRAIEITEARAADPDVQERIAYSHLLMGHLLRQQGVIPEAVAYYDRAVELYSQLGLPTFLYQAHKGRLLCYSAQRSDQQVREEIAATLGLAELHRDKILEEDSRNNFFDAEQSVYDVAIGFEHDRMKDARTAFEHSEFSRARSLLDALNSDARAASVTASQAVRPMPLADIQRLLPEHALIVQYAVLEDKTLIWAISKDEFSVKVADITRQELTKQVLGYWRLVSSAAGDGAAAADEETRRARELYDTLIKPVGPALGKGKQVCIVPDKVLNHLPFDSLVSSTSGRYLVEEHQLVFSPSSTVFIACSQAAGRKKLAPGGERLLSVGNPSFSRQGLPFLPDLPSAEKEATEVSAHYDSARLLISGGARVGLVKEELPKSEVVHLALHSLLDPRFPARSKLLLAQEPAEAPGGAAHGVLTASDISKLELPRTRLVVLSACQTAAERYYDGEGMIGMARPFLAAGVPLVAASLWPVNSDSTAELMISFHKHRKRGNLATAEALRRAQIEMLNGAEPRFRRPYHWAAFIIVGGHAEY